MACRNVGGLAIKELIDVGMNCEIEENFSKCGQCFFITGECFSV